MRASVCSKSHSRVASVHTEQDPLRTPSILSAVPPSAAPVSTCGTFPENNAALSCDAMLRKYVFLASFCLLIGAFVHFAYHYVLLVDAYTQAMIAAG